jgi:hypothetical protein
MLGVGQAEISMPSADLFDLLRLYARAGIADWKNASDELRRRAAECLGTAIADDEAQASVTISTIYNQANASRLRFIPMPKHPRRRIERCFFLPIHERASHGQESTAFDLFLLVGGRDCLAFRFEPAHAPSSAHAYGHVQMCRSLLRKTIEVKVIPNWFPVSYPAFAISTSDPLQMFLSKATAVHGYSGGIVKVLQDIFQKASRPSEAVLYLEKLTTLLLD